MAVQQGRSKRRGESYSALYVEPLSDARTPLADFLSTLHGQLPLAGIIKDMRGTVKAPISGAALNPSVGSHCQIEPSMARSKVLNKQTSAVPWGSELR